MVIKVNPLSAKSVEEAIRQIDEYQNSLDLKLQELLQRLYAIGVDVIDSNIREAQGDSSKAHEIIPKWGGESGKTVELTIRVKGDDIVFIEFGAGIHFNGGPGHAGKSPHPKGMEFGFWIGSYMAQPHYPRKYSLGQYDSWGGSHGTESTAPVYKAGEAIARAVAEEAAKVFGEEWW